MVVGGLHSTEAAPGLVHRVPEMFSKEIFLILLRLINGAGLRKVDSGLKMLFEPIYFWLANTTKKFNGCL